LGRRWHVDTIAEDENIYYPSKKNEKKPDEEDDDSFRQLLYKRFKIKPFIQSNLFKTAIRR